MPNSFEEVTVTFTTDVHKLPAAWKEKKASSVLWPWCNDDDANPEQETAFSISPCPHLATLFKPENKRDNTFMMTFLLQRQ